MSSLTLTTMPSRAKSPSLSAIQPELCAVIEISLMIPDRIVIKLPGRFILFKPADIDSIEPKGNFVSLRVGERTFAVRKTLSALESSLDKQIFRRIHRSVIVNVNKIRELRPWHTGEYVVILDNGKELTLSRTYNKNLAHILR